MFKSLLNLRASSPNYPLFKAKKVSTLVRESIEEKLNEIEKRIFEEKMKCAYQALAQENLKISEDFKYVDSENL
jgi:hypothetical protein